MSTEVIAIASRPKVRLKSVALPIEHGSWGFLLEPLVAGLAVAPSMASPWIALLVIGAFLLRQPLKVILIDRQNTRWLPQTKSAIKFAVIYVAIFSVGLMGSISFARPESFIPFVLVVPFVAYQIYCDSTRNSRQLHAELLGSIAISSSIAVIALADQWTYPMAFALWAVIAARSIPAILYVRNRLNLEKGKNFSIAIPALAHTIALIAIGLMVIYGLVPSLLLPLFSILLIRSVGGLSSYRRRIKAVRIGIWEVVYGLMMVLSIIIGYYRP